MVRYHKNKFKQKIREQIFIAQNNNPQEFWKLVKDLRKGSNKQCNGNDIDLSTWFEHFKSLHSL